MSCRGDLNKVIKRAEQQGWRVEKRKEYYLFFPPDKNVAPTRLPSHPAASAAGRMVMPKTSVPPDESSGLPVLYGQ
jgi:hypothetical protein